MGVSPAAVTQWASAGRIKIADGKVDVEESKRLLRQSGGSKSGGANRGGLAGGAGDRDTDEPAVPTGTLLEARTKLAAAQARKVETEQAVRAGLLVEREKYAKALADAMGPIFAAMAAVSSLKGADLAAETDVRKVQIMLDDAMDEIRRDIAATFRKLIDGARQ